MYGLVDGWVEGWGSCQITKNLINFDLIKIVQFCLKIYDLWRHPYLWGYGWVYGLMGGLSVKGLTECLFGSQFGFL